MLNVGMNRSHAMTIIDPMISIDNPSTILVTMTLILIDMSADRKRFNMSLSVVIGCMSIVHY